MSRHDGTVSAPPGASPPFPLPEAGPGAPSEEGGMRVAEWAALHRGRRARALLLLAAAKRRALTMTVAPPHRPLPRCGGLGPERVGRPSRPPLGAPLQAVRQ